MKQRVAFVTGASRGIGKACAIHLAKAGFDVVITARTANEGEAREHSLTVKQSDVSVLPGSLEETSRLCRAEGRKVLALQADITDFASLGAAAATAIERWGGVDVLVHVARYIGPGHSDLFLDTPIEQVMRHLDGNLIAPLILNKLLIPSMISRGGGVIIDFTSGAAFSDPLSTADKGGWGICYGVSKGAFHRVAGVLATELAASNVRIFNVSPGFTMTERIQQEDIKNNRGERKGAPPDVSGAVTAWLATHPDAAQLNGQTIIAQKLCHEHRLLPDWEGPRFGGLSGNRFRYDMSGVESEAHEQRLYAAQVGKAEA